MPIRSAVAVTVAASLLAMAPAIADDSVLSKVKQSSTIKLGYRENSPPFSFVGDDKLPRGYSIDLCKRVIEELMAQLKLSKLDAQWVAVGAETRFSALKSGAIDLECGNSTQTLSRRAEFDFSLMTFVDGATLLFRMGERPQTGAEMNDQRVAVVAGTTTETALENLVAANKLKLKLFKVKDHDAAIEALTSKTATAYAADRSVLIATALVHGEGKSFELGDGQFTFEPYGLMMRRDAELRLAVDRTLARLYRSGEIGPIMQSWFGQLGSPGEALRNMVLINGLPE
jgi:ABC-type amino acid transport substrate-binding protein